MLRFEQGRESPGLSSDKGGFFVTRMCSSFRDRSKKRNPTLDYDKAGPAWRSSSAESRTSSVSRIGSRDASAMMYPSFRL